MSKTYNTAFTYGKEGHRPCAGRGGSCNRPACRPCRRLYPTAGHSCRRPSLCRPCRPATPYRRRYSSSARPTSLPCASVVSNDPFSTRLSDTDATHQVTFCWVPTFQTVSLFGCVILGAWSLSHPQSQSPVFCGQLLLHDDDDDGAHEDVGVV